jgi:hypothetical protein
MFNDHPNCLMKKARTFLNSQWKFKLFGQNAEFPECSMNIQIVWWKNHWHSYMPNENPNCLMGKSRAFLNVQWTSKLFHGQTSWFPKCSMNIQLVLEKSLDSLNVQWTSKLFHGKITYFPKCSMKIQIVSWTNHLIPSLFSEHPNCLMGKPLDSLNVQWTSKLCHGKITWLPQCSMNMQIASWTNHWIS